MYGQRKMNWDGAGRLHGEISFATNRLWPKTGTVRTMRDDVGQVRRATIVACRLAGLSALEAHYAGRQTAGAMRRRVASSVASFRWQRKSEDWHAIASLATTPPLHRWAILTAASAETRS